MSSERLSPQDHRSSRSTRARPIRLRTYQSLIDQNAQRALESHMNAQPPQRGRHLVTAGGAILPGGNPLARLIAGRFHGVLDRIDAGLMTGSLEAHLPDG